VYLSLPFWRISAFITACHFRLTAASRASNTRDNEMTDARVEVIIVRSTYGRYTRDCRRQFPSLGYNAVAWLPTGTCLEHCTSRDRPTDAITGAEAFLQWSASKCSVIKRRVPTPAQRVCQRRRRKVANQRYRIGNESVPTIVINNTVIF